MGYYGNYQSKSDIVKELADPDNGSVLVKHCYRGNIIWTIERVRCNRKLFIGCYKVEGGRGTEPMMYKPMDESMHPYYYSCPLGYLKEVPVANKQWRDNVVAYHKGA